MKVILLEKIAKLGALGDTVEVKNGYGRNFLLPQGKAVIANDVNVKAFEARKAELEKEQAAKKASAQAQADKLAGKTIEIKETVGEGGKLFGSVGSADIANAIKEQTGVEIAKASVRMPHGLIRLTGEYEIAIALHADVVVNVPVVVAAA